MELVGREASFLLLLFFAALIPFIFFLITEQNLLRSIQPQNRTMSPGEVWLQLIPVFGMIWMFVVVVRMSRSINNELASNSGFSFEQNPSRQNSAEAHPALGIGLAYCILLCVSLIPIVGGMTSLVGIICWIVYWIRIGEFKTKIQSKAHILSSSSTQ